MRRAISCLACAALVLTVAGCDNASHLRVLNATTVPIVLTGRIHATYVAACSMATFTWRGDWTADGGTASPDPAARAVAVNLAPPADGQLVADVLVTANGAAEVFGTASMPPCEGTPPTP